MQILIIVAIIADMSRCEPTPLLLLLLLFSLKLTIALLRFTDSTLCSVILLADSSCSVIGCRDGASFVTDVTSTAGLPLLHPSLHIVFVSATVPAFMRFARCCRMCCLSSSTASMRTTVGNCFFPFCGIKCTSFNCRDSS